MPLKITDLGVMLQKSTSKQVSVQYREGRKKKNAVRIKSIARLGLVVSLVHFVD